MSVAEARSQTFSDVWADAQAEIEALGVEGDPYAVELSRFSVVPLEKLPRHLSDLRRTTCAKSKAQGCFAVVRLRSETGTAERGYLIYQLAPRGNRAQIERVLQHEACHAILWALGDERWSRYGFGHEIPPVRR